MFESNNATTCSGGAVYLDTSTIIGTIMQCTFQNNSARHGHGGAVGILSSSVQVSIASSTFLSNNALYGGDVLLALQKAYFRTVVLISVVVLFG